jgi:hypothetical protein
VPPSSRHTWFPWSRTGSLVKTSSSAADAPKGPAQPTSPFYEGRTSVPDTRRFFVAERYTIADIALYAYTHVAGEGGFDLAAYPSVCAWLARVASQPGHVPITARTFDCPSR